MPRPRGTGCRQRSMGRAGAATQHGGQPGMQGIINLLWADEMDMAVKTARCQDMALTGNGLS